MGNRAEKSRLPPFYEALLGALIPACGCKDVPSLSLPRSAPLACWLRRESHQIPRSSESAGALHEE